MCCVVKVLWNPSVCCVVKVQWNPSVCCVVKVLWNLESILITWYNGDSFESPEDPECAESRQIPQVNAHREVPAKRKGSHCVCVLCTVRKENKFAKGEKDENSCLY